MAAKTLTPSRTLFLCPDRDILADAERAAAGTSLASPATFLDAFPALPDLAPLLRESRPDVLLLSLTPFDRALEVIAKAVETCPGLRILALGEPAPEHLAELVRPEIGGLITLPVTAEKLATALIRLRQSDDKAEAVRASTDRIFAFLPAKAGSGASTVAMNTAIALGRARPERVLLADFDLGGGLLDFMLKSDSPQSSGDVAENLHRLEAEDWTKIVSHVHGVEFLRSPRAYRPVQVPRSNLRILMDFVRRQYGSAVVDLPANPDQAALELLPESDKVFLVTTLEPSCLRLAREKVDFLRDNGYGERLRVLVNRCSSHRRDMAALRDVEEFVGLPAMMSFSNDYAGVQAALLDGRGVSPGSPLGGQFRAFAERLLENRPAQAAKPRWKFLEQFYLAVKHAPQYARR